MRFCGAISAKILGVGGIKSPAIYHDIMTIGWNSSEDIGSAASLPACFGYTNAPARMPALPGQGTRMM
jgi:hypothetical protein